jgi:hypothetical protein
MSPWVTSHKQALAEGREHVKAANKAAPEEERDENLGGGR